MSPDKPVTHLCVEDILLILHSKLFVNWLMDYLIEVDRITLIVLISLHSVTGAL